MLYFVIGFLCGVIISVFHEDINIIIQDLLIKRKDKQ